MADPSPDLETRIRLAERAVIERDRRVRRRGGELVQRIERGAKRGVVAALLAGVAALGLGWTAPARGLGAAPPRGPGPGPGAASTSPAAWAALVPLVWPWLPPTWRRRVSPATAALVVSVGLPMVRALLPARPPVTTAPDVDLRRFAGRWYEIARLPAPAHGACAADATATYTLGDDHVRVDHRWRGRDGVERRAHGIAYVVESSRGAKLDVSLFPRGLRWLPWAWTACWILEVDAHYRHAVVGSPGRKGLSLLARSPRIDDATYQRLVGIAAARGYRVDRLQRIPQSG